MPPKKTGTKPASKPKPKAKSRAKAKKQTVVADQVMPFNFKSIKDFAKPGGWRRGYGYYKTKGQVLSVELTDTGVQGKVKGNFKDAYTVNLYFDPDLVTAQCDCPLDEEWCKHSVAVGLETVDRHYFEQFWNVPFEEVPEAPTVEETEHYEGTFRFVIDWQIKAKHVSILVHDRRQNVVVPRLDPIIKSAVELQRSGQLNLNPTEKRELKLIQFLYKTAEQDPKTPWNHVPPAQNETFLNLLADVEEVVLAETNTLVRFETEPLHLVLSVNASSSGNVMTSLHWHLLGYIPDVFPLEEVELFGREVPWGYRRNKFYPLTAMLRNLPKYLAQNTFYDLKDADGGKFIFEELPHIAKIVEVEKAEAIDKATLEQDPPKRVVTLRTHGITGLRAELEFSYDTTKVPYSKGNDDAPYVTVVNKKDDSLYWLKRDKKLEEKAYQTLLKTHLQPMQTNHFSAEEDHAIDFFNFEMPQLMEQGWDFQSDEDLSRLSVAEFPLQIKADLDFSAESVDQFVMHIYCGIGPEKLDLDKVQEFFSQGQKYIYMQGKGYVEIPLAPILQLTKTLNSFDKESLGNDTYMIKTYQAGLISEFIDQGMVLNMSDRFQKFWDLVTSFNELEEVAVPDNINAELRPYQKQGFNWLWFLYSYGLNGILADDMGLGKTLQTLVTLQKAKNMDGQMPTLIICPTSIVFNWEKEAQRFTPDLNILTMKGSDRHHNLKKIKEADLVITSYALLRRDYKILRQFHFRYIILDESQNIKNVESLTARAVKELHAQHRLALSGTPIENRLSELWSQFDYLMPGFLLDLDEFRYRYITPIEEKGNRDAERRLKKQISPFILRRLKKDVAKDLPDKIENTTYCELTKEQQDLYMEVLEKTREEVFAQFNAKGEAVSQAKVLASLLRLRQVCCHPSLLKDFMSHDGIGSGKFEAMQEMIEEIISEGHRILLFSQFVEMLKIIKKWLEVKGIKHEYLTGETKDRQSAVERFNRDSSIPIFLISLKAGGTGLNLTGADYVIHYDPWWNPAAEDQATDRAHRIGQTKKVFVYRLITRGTVEEKILKLQDRKRGLVDSVIGADRDLGKSFSFQDLKDILTPDF